MKRCNPWKNKASVRFLWVFKVQLELKEPCVIFVSLLLSRAVKFNCSVLAYIWMGPVERLAANKLSQNLTPSKTSLSLQNTPGSPTDPSKQHSSAAGEVRKNYLVCVFCCVSSNIHPTPPSLMLDSLRPSHPHLGGLFFFAAGLTSLFNSIDSRLHFGWRGRKCTWVFTHAVMFAVPGAGHPEKGIN